MKTAAWGGPQASVARALGAALGLRPLVELPPQVRGPVGPALVLLALDARLARPAPLLTLTAPLKGSQLLGRRLVVHRGEG